MVLFDKNILPHEEAQLGWQFLLVGRYYQCRVYGNNTLSVHSCKRRTRTRMRKVRKQANVHSTIISPDTFLFCPSHYIHVDFRVFLDVSRDTAFVVVHTHVL